MANYYIKPFFDDLCKDHVFDMELLKAVNAFRIGFMTKNEEHINFFGGNLTGVQKVRFTGADETVWAEEFIGASVEYTQNGLYKLPTIIRNFKVSSDALNNSFIYFIHRFLTSEHLNKEERFQGALEVAMIMNYRFLTSRLVTHFKYQADVEIARAVFDSLSAKYAIKRHGNWQKTIEARSIDFIDEKKSLWYKYLLTMKDDIEIRKAINDAQGRIRSMVRGITNVHMQFHAEGKRIRSTSSSFEFEGEEVLKDQVGGFEPHFRYLISIVSDKNSFIKDPLFRVVCKVMPNMQPRLLDKTLNYLVTETKKTDKRAPIEQLITDNIVFSLNYVNERKDRLQSINDITGIITLLKGTYTSSKAISTDLTSIRNRTEDLVRDATKVNHKGQIGSTRTGVLLYLVLRTLTKSRFK